MALFSAKCNSTSRLDGKVAIVTGANTGIGKETVKDFYLRGGRVIMICRDLEKACEAAEEIKKECENKRNVGSLCIKRLDLSNMESVKKCAKNIMKGEERIDLLVNNAGVFTPLKRTDEGFELTFATNHLGPFLLTLLLLPKICRNASARIINVSSSLHSHGSIHFDDLNWQTRKYSAFTAYAESKLANVLFTQELARRLNDAGIKGVTVYCLHPGGVYTDLFRYMDQTMFHGASWLYKYIIYWILKSPKQGAQTTIYCGVDEKCANETGLYYDECRVKAPAKNAQDKVEDARRLWEESLKLVGLPEDYDPFHSNNILKN